MLMRAIPVMLLWRMNVAEGQPLRDQVGTART
jgi:hypothetical protein